MANKSFKTELEYSGLRECQIEKHIETTVKCTVCNSSDVEGVCHHCGRFLCGQHIAKPRIYQDPSQEFAPMLGGRKWAKAVHCKEHAHFVFSALKTMVLPGGIVTAFSFLFVFVGLVSIGMFVADLLSNDLHYSIWMTWLVSTWMSADRGLVLDLLFSELGGFLMSMAIFLIGLGVFVYGLVLHFRKYLPQAKKVELGMVPVLPSQYVIQTNDAVKVEIDVSEAPENYMRLVSRKGSVSMSVSLDKSAQRSLEESQRKAHKYGWKRPRFFDFGYVALDRIRWVQMTGRLASARPIGNLYHLVRDNVDIIDLVEEGHWHKIFQWNYIIDDQALRFRKDADLPGRFAVWFKPILLPMSAGRAIGFEFDLPEEIEATAKLKEFILYVPEDTFGDLDASFPVQRTNGQAYPDIFEVRWMNWEINNDSTQWPQVTFSQDVTRMAAPMTAAFEIRIDTTLSGLQVERDDIWFPTGRPALKKEATASMEYKTLISGQATVDPRVFSYQYERTYTRILQKHGIPLTPERVKDVLQTLAGAKVSIKNVSQREPVVELQEGAVLKRSWDILGRYYSRIYPVDVHVALSGREPLDEEERANSGATIQLTLRVLVNSKAKEMEQAVEGLCTRFENLLAKVVS